MEWLDTQIQATWVEMSAQLFTGCVTLGKLFNFSVLQITYLEKKDDNIMVPPNEVMCIMHLCNVTT